LHSGFFFEEVNTAEAGQVAAQSAAAAAAVPAGSEPQAVGCRGCTPETGRVTTHRCMCIGCGPGSDLTVQGIPSVDVESRAATARAALCSVLADHDRWRVSASRRPTSVPQALCLWLGRTLDLRLRKLLDFAWRKCAAKSGQIEGNCGAPSRRFTSLWRGTGWGHRTGQRPSWRGEILEAILVRVTVHP
jgi:hypothetical protein